MTRASTTTLLASLLLAPVVGAGCGAAEQDGAPAAVVSTPVATETATFAVSGMTCASCAVTIKIAVNKLDGIASVNVDADAGTATVSYDAATVSADQIARTITDTGFAATVTATTAS